MITRNWQDCLMFTRISIFFIVVILGCSFVIANLFSPMKIFEKGLRLKSITYNKNNEVEDSVIVEIDSIYQMGNSITGFCRSTTFYGRGEAPETVALTINCIDRDFEPGSFGAANTISWLTSGKADSTSRWLYYPLDMKVGDTLENAVILAQYQKKFAEISNIDLCKVIAFDTISTPAGSFPCFVITYQATETYFGMRGLPPQAMKVKEWFNPDFGIVKWEQRQDGKVKFWSELVSISH